MPPPLLPPYSSLQSLLSSFSSEKENNSNKLFIYQQKGEKKKIFKSLDKLGNIQSNILYFTVIKFTNKKIRIFLNKLDKIYEKLDEENDTYEIDKASPILKICHDDIKNEYFKGYIGSFIAIKDLSIKLQEINLKYSDAEFRAQRAENLQKMVIIFLESLV